MPIILDANRACDFNKPMANHAATIATKITKKKTRVSLGGKLLKELSQTKMRTLILEWMRNGLVKRVDDALVDEKEAEVNRLNVRSNDAHVLALSIVSKARLLYSEDGDLIQDFKDKNIIDFGGKVITPTTSERYVAPLLERFG